MFTLAIWGILTITQTGFTLLAWAIYPHHRMVATTFYATFLLQMALLVYTINHATTSPIHLAPVWVGIGIALMRLFHVAFIPNYQSSPIRVWMLQWLLFTTLFMPYVVAQPNIVYPSTHPPIQWPWLLIVCLGGMGVGIVIPTLYHRMVTMGVPKSRGMFCFTLKPQLPRWMKWMFQPCRAINTVFPTHWPHPLRAWVRRWSTWRYSRPLLRRNALPTDAQSYDDWSGWVWNVGWAESVSTGIHALGYPSSWENVPSLLHGVSVLYGPNQWGGCGLWSQQDSTLPSAEWAMMRTLVSHAGIHDGDTILECGNGLGGFTHYLAQRFPNATIISLVPTQYHADFLAQHAQIAVHSNVQVLVEGDALSLPLASIDRIVMGAMGGYGASYQAWWCELRRWLRPQGVLVGYQPTHSHHSVRIAQTQNGVSDWIQSWIPKGYIPDLQSMIMAQTAFQLDEHWAIPSDMMAKTFGAWRMNLNRVGINNLVQLTGLHHGIWENCDRALHWMQSLFTVQPQFGITVYRCNPVIE